MNISSNDKKFIILIILISLVCSIILILNIFKILKYPAGHPDNILFSIKTTNNIDYEVYLKDNEFIEDDYLKQNYSYINELIDYIEIKFDYNALTNKLDDPNISYFIDADMVFNTTDELALNNKLLNKNFILSEIKTYDYKDRIDLSIPINIKLNQYNEIINKFSNELNLQIDAFLEVKLNINIKNEELNKNHILTTTIPLGKKIFEISTNTNFEDEEIIYNQNHLPKEKGYVTAIIYIIVLILQLIITYLLIKHIYNKKYSKYSLEKNKILKEYDDRIVTVKNFIKHERWEIVDVKNFNELLDLANEAYEPIFYFEKRLVNKKEAWFSILRDKILYRYVIHSYQTTK